MIILVMFLSIMLLKSNMVSKYKGNTWGELFRINSEYAHMYLNSYGELSIYKVNNKDVIMCDSNQSDGERLFCWLILDRHHEPIAGWIDAHKADKIERGNIYEIFD